MDVKINNIPEYANHYKYVVATLVEGQLWFYNFLRRENPLL